MKAFKILVGVIIFFIIAALIGYGFEWLFIKVLPGNIASTLTAASAPVSAVFWVWFALTAFALIQLNYNAHNSCFRFAEKKGYFDKTRL